VSADGRAWLGVAALLGCCALLGWPIAHTAIDWQPALAFSEPWRAWSAIGVHYSAQHLIANLAGIALAGAFGWAARVPARLAWAWMAAWPLTHLALLAKPELTHYGGLSGVLHAGVGVVAASLLITGSRAQRWVGAAVVAGLCAKLWSESPWGAALRYPPGWDIAVAPMAHLTGSIAGLVCAAVALVLPRRPMSNDSHRTRARRSDSDS
jgi:rhomboid family GlyGly-CTERM serine protease